MMTAPVRGVLFDLDDTLFDRAPVFLAYATWLARERLTLRDEAEREAAISLLVTLDAGGYGSKAAMFTAIRERYPVLTGEIETLVDEFREQLCTHMTGVDAATAGLLDELDRRGLPWGIVTNGSANQLAKIRSLTLEHRARVVLVSDIFGVRKPEQEVFRHAAVQLGLAPAQILFVGDHPVTDIQGAHRAGMRTAWLRRGRSWPVAVADCTPSYVIDAIADLHLPLFTPVSP